MDPHPASLALWGGLECTVNRVGDRYFDQLEYSGHAERISDLDRFYELGLRTLRYPILWERAARGRELDFAWADERLARLYALGIEPIVGLVHHGSGPPHTSLLDPAFPELLAAYAGRVAERYPWLTKFTPINEPLTTARFTGLYGHWYPHARSDAAFVRALLIQCRGTVLAMRAIRRSIPHAELIQTEDLAVCTSVDELAYQAEFENRRRWLSLDLLCGKVDRHHPLNAYLRKNGATDADLGYFLDDPCIPNVIGFNYYVTSERFLDNRLHLYPPEMVGGNARHAYVDVEAVRVCAVGLMGPLQLLESAADRFGLPMAITEAHLACSPSEQASWLAYVWRSCLAAQARGLDIRAVTAWALLGSFGWNKLVTEDGGKYEPGVLRLEGGVPVETDVASLVRELADGRLPENDGAGWWCRHERLLYEAHMPPVYGASAHSPTGHSSTLVGGESPRSVPRSAPEDRHALPAVRLRAIGTSHA
ncbi:MAG: glycoside hydrolase [Polyangiaceae bacterium]|nr:glycoside hydrolase [Polyangiaceae bacterium]